MMAGLAVSACSTEASVLPGSSAMGAESAVIEVNTVDLEFIARVLPTLRSAVSLGERILMDEDLDPKVRRIAERSLARPQDEIIHINELREQWEGGDLDLETHTRAAMKVTDPTGARAVPPSQGDLQRLNDSWGVDHELTYLLLLRQQLNESIALAEHVATEGASPRLNDIAEQMVEVKTHRVGQIDAYLASINEEPRALR